MHPGLQRHQGELRHRADRERARGGDRLRPRPADGRLLVRVVRRMHGLLSDGSLDEQARPRRRAAGGHLPRRRRAAGPAHVPRGIGDIPRAESWRRGATDVCAGRNHLPRGRVRIDGLLHPERQGRHLHRDPHRSRQGPGAKRRRGRGALLPATQRPRVERRRSPGGQPPSIDPDRCAHRSGVRQSHRAAGAG